MSARDAARLRAVAAGFEKLAVPALSVRPGRWRLMLVNGRPLAADARLDDGWLEIGARLGSPLGRGETWNLLRLAGELPAGVKPVLCGAALGVRAELRADLEETTFRRRLAEALAATLAAARRLEEGKLLPVGEARNDGEPTAWPELGDELVARRWTARERGAGRWSVDLAGDASLPSPAEIAHFATGSTALSIAASAPGERAGASDSALAHYLLASAADLRLVRAAADGDGGARFEVRFASRPLPGELEEALGALAAAARLVLPAAAALTDEATARWYLAGRGRMAAPAAGGRRTTKSRRGASGGATSLKREVNRGNC